MKYYM